MMRWTNMYNTPRRRMRRTRRILEGMCWCARVMASEVCSCVDVGVLVVFCLSRSRASGREPSGGDEELDELLRQIGGNASSSPPCAKASVANEGGEKADGLPQAASPPHRRPAPRPPLPVGWRGSRLVPSCRLG